MTKSLLLNFCLLAFTFNISYSQVVNDPIPEASLPDVIPPSPTVANLMKFEEVPVNHYTGVPDISLPIYSTKISNNLNFNMSLAYNPLGIRVDERSGWTGTGWSLNAESVISRTVMDVPDEIYSVGGSTDFHQGDVGTFRNNYKEFSDMVANGFVNATQGDLDDWEEFVWKTSQGVQHYDYQPDLYQFSFFGYSGRFFIVNENGTLVPKIISSDQKVEIILNYDTFTQFNHNSFEITSFEVIDPNGNKFVFASTETSSSSPVQFGTAQLGAPINPNILAQQKVMTYTSAWKLTSIYAPNNVLLASYDYWPVFEEFDTPQSYEYNTIVSPIINPSLSGSLKSFNAGLLPPKDIRSYSENEIASLKLKEIVFRDSSKIEFTKNQGHPEYKNSNSCKLFNIKAYSSSGLLTKNMFFNYSTTTNDRLFLDTVYETSSEGTLSYYLTYENKDDLPEFGSTETDRWGYYNSGAYAGGVSLPDVKTGVLTCIEFPTGGKKEFNFESNEITYVGGELVSIYEIPENRDSEGDSFMFSGDVTVNNDLTLPQVYFVYMDITQPVKLNYTTTVAQQGGVDVTKHRLNIYSVDLDPQYTYDPYATTPQFFPQNESHVINPVMVGSYNLDETQMLSVDRSLSPGFYMIKIEPLSPYIPNYQDDYLQVNLSTYYSKFEYNTRKMKGGGLRIKDFTFTDQGNEESKTSFNYDLVGDDSSPVNPSSSTLKLGSGMFDGSLMMYRTTVKDLNYIMPIDCVQGSWANFGSIGPNHQQTAFKIRTTKKLNSVLPQMTKGNYVGYQNVSVSKQDNGRTDYEFTTSKDYPSYDSSYYVPNTPYYYEAPVPDMDYKRGLLTKESVFNKDGDTLKVVSKAYGFEELADYEYFYIYSETNCAQDLFYDNYTSFHATIPNVEHPCNTRMDETPGGNCIPTSYIDVRPVNHIWGRSFLTETIAKDYFYDDSNNQTVTEARQTLVYEDSNFQIKEQHLYFEEGGLEQHLENKYYYPIGGTPSGFDNSYVKSKLINLNRLSDVLAVESYKNEELVAKVITEYHDFETDVLILPQSMETAKGEQSEETRIEFHRYDTYGNPLEVSESDGTHISYIWGYNNMYPVAKLVDVEFSEIETLLGSNFNSGTSSLTTQNIIDLKTAFPNAQISTYKYTPGVGVISMIDPRGYEMKYTYDGLNRLEYVKDGTDHILSKNEYFYGTPNYVKTTTYQIETLGTVTDDEKIETITYIDGLGRPIQSIAKQAGGNKQDIITPIVYDNIGRQTMEYLPYADPDQVLGTASLSYRDPIALLDDLEEYYVNKYTEDQITSTTINAYSEKHLEDSPLNRVLEQGAPGKDWQVDFVNDTDHTIKMGYQTNVVTDKVERYKVIFPTLDTEAPELFWDGKYAANELYKTITKDENWTSLSGKRHTTEEYKNKQGQVLLKRTYNDLEAVHDTYYVYDDFGNLTYVFSPEGSDHAILQENYTSFSSNYKCKTFPTVTAACPGYGGATLSVDANTNQLSLVFDLQFSVPTKLKRGPIVQVSNALPNIIIGYINQGSASYIVSIVNGFLYIQGDGEITGGVSESFTVNLPDYLIDNTVIDKLCYQYRYDDRNRLVEKKIPQKGWEYIVYDKLDRPVLTQDANLRTSNAWLFTKYDVFDRVVYTGKYANSDSRKDLQDDFDAQSNHNEVRNGTATNVGTENISMFYSNQVFPTTNLTEIHMINYYDSYNAHLTAVSTDPGTVFSQDTTINTQTLPTGSKTRVLDTADWITTVMYYDDKGRAIYVESENSYLDTNDIVKTELDFVGKVLKTETTHTKTSTSTNIVVTDYFTYDHAGRMLTQKQQIGTGAQELIVKNTYDELGQLVEKGVGGIEASPLQHVDYSYNIRGWLKGINDKDNLGNDLFAFGINYNTTELGQSNEKLFNGNISETIWKTANDVSTTTTRGYAYVYDPLNRLNTANMSINTGAGFGLATGYHENGFLYDKNGNIMTLQRTGATAVFDDLTYSYDGNQLTQVDDAITNQQTEGFIDGANTGPDYDYDANGNMIEDKNKGITNISYNHLNLPTTVNFGLSDKIEYIYDATGVKLEKKVTDNSDITQTYYAGNYIYEEGGTGETLKFFSHPEGYVEPDGQGAYNYVYQYKDHLGNIRLSYSDADGNGSINASTEIIEENNYYPFGLKHKGYNNVVTSTNPAQKYKFGGKELNDELGLDWYDFGARNYDASIGRWMNIDPLAEKFYYDSPFVYTTNNPIRYADVDGREWVDANGNKVYDSTIKNEDGTTGAYTKHATNEHRNLGRLLVGTKTGQAQFDKLVSSDAKIQTVIHREGKPVDEDGNPIQGEVAPRQTMVGTNSDGEAEVAIVQSGTINFYLENIDDLVAVATDGDASTTATLGENKASVEGLNFGEILAAIFGHEIEHTTNENALTAAQNGNVETVPTEISDQIIKELKENRKKDD